MKPSPRDPIVQERIIQAPPEAVFRAWSDPASLSLWMRPDPTMAPATVKLDFRVGGHFSIAMHGEEQNYEHVGEYLAIDPPKRLVFTWVSRFIPEPYSATRVSVSIEPADGGASRITLVHDELPDTDHYDGHVEGWEEILRKLSSEFVAG